MYVSYMYYQCTACVCIHLLHDYESTHSSYSYLHLHTKILLQYMTSIL